MTHAHDSNTRSCTISFDDKQQRNKALKTLLNAHDRFDVVGKMAYRISTERCNQFELLRKKKEIIYTNTS
jgi:hypothetical protein